MPIYRKGEDQSELFSRGHEQMRNRKTDAAARGGFLAGYNPSLTVEEYSKELGGGPVSAEGMRRGKVARHNAGLDKNK